ncbi:MAG: aromatic acid exporter family protein [Lachnospiraceae bacterium]|nr:aromatic acid exporter family protein [Lachnospiraceae bacterium]
MKLLKIKYLRILLLAVKIAVGSSAAIFLAELLNLNFSASAGTITLLTLVMTKWETVRLSLARLVTFFISAFLGILIFTLIRSDWIAYGLYIFFTVMICELLDWRATLSVNAVIGSHFLTTAEWGMTFIVNELDLLLIGISLALLLNLFQNNRTEQKHLVQNMRNTEAQFKRLLRELADYLSEPGKDLKVWDETIALEKQMQKYLDEAYAYYSNTFHSHSQYYIDYFEMRLNQCHVLHNLHYEMKKMRQMPEQARVVSGYVYYLADHVTEKNMPQAQLDELHRLIAVMQKEDPLPTSREEFEGQAILYHVLLDLEDFLIFKKRFVDGLGERQKERYWI